MTNKPDRAKLITTYDQQAAENERLRAAIKDAPHSDYCDKWQQEPPQDGEAYRAVLVLERDCTCWKAAALERIEGLDDD